MNLAHAAPDFERSGDALSRMLSRGVTSEDLSSRGPENAPTIGFVQQMRNKASDMVLASMNFLGVRYVRGGTSAEGGFDCSGFTRYIFEHSLGLVLPRRADEQAKAAGLRNVKRDELKPGDLVFFNTLKRTFSHVGIYIGEGKFIHSPRSGSEVRVEDMRQSYWTKRFTGGRRVEQAEGGPSAETQVSAGSSSGSSVVSSVSSLVSSSMSSSAGNVTTGSLTISSGGGSAAAPIIQAIQAALPATQEYGAAPTPASVSNRFDAP